MNGLCITAVIRMLDRLDGESGVVNILIGMLDDQHLGILTGTTGKQIPQGESITRTLTGITRDHPNPQVEFMTTSFQIITR